MSVPFSNTYLRVPRGFGSILEGLAREVLRDQPEDIPEYAAHYFQTLLTKREESGVDPAEWAAKLEDRFYNNHAFKTTETSPANEKATEVTVSNVKAEEKGQKSSAGDHQLQEENHREKSYESQTEDESTYSEEVSQPIDFEKAENIHKEESINRFQIADIQSDEPRGTDKESDPAITVFDQVDRAANETDSNSVPDQNIPQSELESTDLLSFRGLSNVDVCAQELGAAEHEEGDKQGSAVVDKEIVDSGVEEKTEVAVPVEVFTYSALADVDVCATELGGPERTKQAATVEDVTHVAEKKENLKPKPEDIFLESSSPKSEITENTQQAAEDHTEKTKEETAESNSRKTDVSLAHGEGGLDGNVTPKEGSLVEISFEDIPEAQQISQVGEKKPEEEKEESKELTAIARGHYISDIQDHHIHKTEQIEKEANCEKEETESQLGAMHIMIEKVNTSDLNLNKRDDNDEEEKGENIISSNQPSAEAEKENEEDENNPKNENIEKISEDKFQQNEDSVGETYSNEPEFREGQMTDVFGENKEETHKEGYSERDQEINDGGAENNSSQVTQSNTSMARMGAESKTFEESAQHQLEENEKHQRILVQLQPENTVEEKGLVSKETEELTVGMTDSEVQEKRDTIHEEENVSLPHTADMTADGQQGEEKLLESEKDCAEFAGRSTKKQEECSRPQEEEDIMDIPLDDPEANRAAAKIQAGFRGHMTRKKMKPEDKTEGEEVSNIRDVLNSRQGDSETGRSGAVERDGTSVPEQ